MAYLTLQKGSSANLNNVAVKDGQILVTTDTKKIYLDNGSERLDLYSSSLTGGYNLCYDTDKNNSWNWSHQTAETTSTIEAINGTNVQVLTRDNNESTGWAYIGYGKIDLNKLEDNRDYYFSFEVWSSIECYLNFSAIMSPSAINPLTTSTVQIRNKIPAATWTTCIYKFTTKIGSTSRDGQILYLNSTRNDTGMILKFKNPCLVRADFASGYISLESKYTYLHNNNYTDYTVKKDGTGASGIWNINITGNAATATIASGNLPHFFVTNGTEVAKNPREATSGWYHMTFGDETILPTSNHGSVLIENNCGTPYQLFFPDNQLDVYKRFGTSSWGTWQRLNAGYAETASRLATARTISLTGAVTGSGSFDGSGNLSIATNVNHTHNYAPVDGNKKRYTFDLSGYSENNFYLITFPSSDWELDCEIFNGGGSAARSYNENHLRFVWNKQGWSDSPACLHILYSGCYSSSEITIMGLVQGNQNGVRGIAIRGGDHYYLCVNQTPTLRTSNYTDSTETFNVGGTSWGTGTNVSIAWTNNGINQSYTDIPFYGAVWN